MLIKLSDRIINLDRVNQIEYSLDPSVVSITWATGDCPLYLHGNQAIALMDAIEHLGIHHGKRFVDASVVEGMLLQEDVA